MKADWNDAPARVKTKKRKVPPFHVSIIATVMVFGITVYLAKDQGWMHGWVESFSSGVDKSKEVAHQPAEAPQFDSSPTAEDVFWQEIENERNAAEVEAPPQLKQTVFNDQNYKPRTDINTVQLTHAVRADLEAGRRRSEHARNVSNNTLNGSRNANFRWRDARGRVTQWNTSYTFQNSKIDNTTFCRNYGSGSIEYRTCRKAAQQWLKTRCGNANKVQDEWQRMYCLAANGFRT